MKRIVVAVLCLGSSACATAPDSSASNDTSVDGGAGAQPGWAGWPGSGGPDSGPGSGEDAGVVPSGGGGAPAAVDAGIDVGTTTDPFAEKRQLCVDHINQLRATKGLAPYARWTSAEACVDLQVTHDQQVNKPHDAWMSHEISCNGYGMAQNECQGAGGIVGCLNLMWAEKDQPGCAGCDECDSPGGCADCDFFGTTTGDVCGHYVNLRSSWYTEAACGFTSSGSWSAINFQ